MPGAAITEFISLQVRKRSAAQKAKAKKIASAVPAWGNLPGADMTEFIALQVRKRLAAQKAKAKKSGGAAAALAEAQARAKKGKGKGKDQAHYNQVCLAHVPPRFPGTSERALLVLE